MSSKIQEPYQPKAKLLAWSEFNTADIDRFLILFQSSNSNEIYPYLEKILDLNSSYLKPKILLDLHYYALKFAIENEFTKIQISAFLSILRAIHKTNEETPLENYNYLIRYFNELIICHSIQRPPFCVEIFDSQKIVKVINYITRSYLRHYKLYKYVYTPIVGLRLEVDYGDKLDEEDEVDSVLDNNSDLKTDSNSELRTKTSTSIGTSIVKIQESNNESEQDVVENEGHNQLKKYLKSILAEYVKSDEIRQGLESVENHRLEMFSQKTQEEVAKAQKKK
ncbi:unnamed protein product [Brachionus calyciflorus]|uniref:Coiled-coil domain-containing protein 189 n=1 Tax=Brachionus calyciflorus TaxID=104777 RepID=A0A814A6C6_9BILA|nr:unnamed protein product [Brachionus calyciflorus]